MKLRLTKARNQISMFTLVRRVIKKLKSESEKIEKIIHALKETVVLSNETLEVIDLDTAVHN